MLARMDVASPVYPEAFSADCCFQGVCTRSLCTYSGQVAGFHRVEFQQTLFERQEGCQKWPPHIGQQTPIVLVCQSGTMNGTAGSVEEGRYVMSLCSLVCFAEPSMDCVQGHNCITPTAVIKRLFK